MSKSFGFTRSDRRAGPAREANSGGENAGKFLVLQFIEEIFYGVHEFKPEYRGPAKTKVFQGSHPESIQKSMISLKQRFEKELKKYEN